MLNLVICIELKGIIYIVSLVKPINSLPITGRLYKILCTLLANKATIYPKDHNHVLQNMFYLTKKGYPFVKNYGLDFNIISRKNLVPFNIKRLNILSLQPFNKLSLEYMSKEKNFSLYLYKYAFKSSQIKD